MKQDLNNMQRLGLPTPEGLSFIEPVSIVYIQPDDRQSMVYTTCIPEPIRILVTLTDMERRLDKYQCFFRTHRSCIVNMLHINHVFERELKVVTSLGEIPISRENLKKLKSLYCAEN